MLQEAGGLQGPPLCVGPLHKGAPGGATTAQGPLGGLLPVGRAPKQDKGAPFIL